MKCWYCERKFHLRDSAINKVHTVFCVCGATTCPHYDVVPRYSWIEEHNRNKCLNVWCSRRMEQDYSIQEHR
jgi:hypothetical protein